MIEKLRTEKSNLNGKFIRYVLMIMGVALLTYLILSGIGKAIIHYGYDNDSAYERYTNNLNQQLSEYIQTNQVCNNENGNQIIVQWAGQYKNVVVLMVNRYNAEGKGSDEVPVYNADEFTFYSPFSSGNWSLETSEVPYSSRGYDYKLYDGMEGMTFFYVLESYVNRYNRMNQYISIGISLTLFIVLLLSYIFRTNLRIRNFRNDLELLSGGGESQISEIVNGDEIGEIANSALSMNKNLLQSYKREEKLMQELIDVQRGIAHDIRTPLTILSGNLEILKDEMQEKDQTCIDKCMERVDQINALVGKLLDSSKEMRREEKIESSTSTLGEYIEIFQAQLNIDGYKTSIDGDETLYDCVLWIPYLEMKRIFDNLYSNIVKYASHEEMISIQVCRLEEGNIRITIENEIKDETGRVSSYGLGEKICREILSEYGGNYRGERIGNCYRMMIKVNAATNDGFPFN